MQRSNAHEHIELEDDPSSHYELKDSMRKSLAPKLSGSDLTYDSKEPSTFPAWGKKIEMALMSVEPQVTLLVHIVNLIVGRALTNEKVEAATLPEALMNPKLAWIAPGNSDPREATEQTLQQHSSDGSSQRDSFEHLSHEPEYQRPTTRAESAQRGRDSDAEQTPPPQTREHFERPPGLPGHSEGERIYASPTKSKSSIYNPALKYQYSSVQDLPPAVVELNYYLFNILLSLITGPKAVEIANFPSAHRCYTSVMVFLYEEDNVSITSRKWSSYKALLEMEYNGDPLSWSSTVIERVRDLYTSEFSIQDIVMFNLQRMFAGKNSDISLMITQDIQDLSKWKPGNILDSGAGRHICSMVKLTDEDSIERLRGFNGTLEHTSGKGYKPIKVSTDTGDELHWDIKDKDYFQADTTEQSMCKLSPKPTSLVAKIGTTVDVSSHDAKHLKDIIMQVLQSSKNDNDDTLHSDWNIPTGNVAYNVSCEA